MSLYPNVKELIHETLQLDIEEISEMGSEELDKYIANEIVKHPLKIQKVASDLVPDRGLIFSTISNQDLDKNIDLMLARG